jgi:hypothetical protein
MPMALGNKSLHNTTGFKHKYTPEYQYLNKVLKKKKKDLWLCYAYKKKWLSEVQEKRGPDNWLMPEVNTFYFLKVVALWPEDIQLHINALEKEITPDTKQNQNKRIKKERV